MSELDTRLEMAGKFLRDRFSSHVIDIPAGCDDQALIPHF